MEQRKASPWEETALFAGSGRIVLYDPKTSSIDVCGYTKVRQFESEWKNTNPLMDASTYLTQLALTIFVVHLCLFILKFARVPRFLAELLSAFILGVNGIQKEDWFARYLVPNNDTQPVEMMASIGLTFYMFVVGLEMNLANLRSIEKKVMWNVGLGIVGSLVGGRALYLLILKKNKQIQPEPLGFLFIGVALSATSFPDLARILADLKILHTDVGRMALSSAFLNDLIIWVFIVATTISTHKGYGKISIISSIIFVLACWYVVRPILSWKIPNIKSSAITYTDSHVFSILTGVFLFGFIADACGMHSMVGGFVFGLSIPKGELVNRMSQKLEPFVTGILLPPFFFTVGLRMNTRLIPLDMWYFMLFAVLASSIKLLVTFIVTMFYGMSIREGFTTGVLMNTKGILGIIVLSLGLETKALHLGMVVLMTMVYVAMGFIVKLIPYLIYSPKNHMKEAYFQRTIESVGECDEFRVLVCIHATHNIAGLTNVLAYSNSTSESPISVLAAHLVELVGRATAMLIVHGRQASMSRAESNPTGKPVDVDQVITALEEFEYKGLVQSVQTWTLVSPYDTMHEDVNNLAEDKFANLILIPFNKSSSTLEEANMPRSKGTSIRKLTQNILKTAPCSVGMLLDRGMGLLRSRATYDGEDNERTPRQGLQVAMFFCGGPDSREALAYAYRMAGSSDVQLTVVRFVPGDEAKDMMIEEFTEFHEEERIDDHFVKEFKHRIQLDSSIVYIEKTVNSGHEIIGEIGDLFDEFQLCIVGRGEKVIAPFERGFTEWVEAEELGGLADALSTSRFAESASILVIQKYKE
ncbi:hypothetical protein Tsubulata_009987 [Turnera subulata]|uniref:Cation/H+ exchanger domain-containing protein n=1 Tax=Turnera subulata TaxID=218843 RepID=A0A9Q0G7E8_9ROSI|nr:hypothetical protein Tsubulata_009987 [Turnera subulata]